MTIAASWVDRNKVKVIVGVLVLGGAAMGVEIWQSRESAATDQALSDAIADLSTSSKEQAELTRRVNEAQGKVGESQDRVEKSQLNVQKSQEKNSTLTALNIELTRKNAALAEEIRQRTIGDPKNPPFLRFADFDNSTGKMNARAYLINSSTDYVAREVSVTIGMENQMYTTESQDIPPSADGLQGRVSVTFPASLADNRMVGFPQLSNVGDRLMFQVILTTAAGPYKQDIVLVRISEKEVSQGSRIFKASDSAAEAIYRSDKDFYQKTSFDWSNFKMSPRRP